MPETAVLKPKEERRLLRGHRWAYRNEFASLPEAPDGALIDVAADGGRFVGRGFFQASGGIAVRLLTLEDKPVDAELLRARILRARRYRERLYAGAPVYRWVYGESDGLPAFIADRYDTIVSIQAGNPFYGHHADVIAAAFMESGGVKGVRFEICGKTRRFGELGSPAEVLLNGVHFLADIEHGQKTGLFLDQRENVRMLEPIAEGARVLDGHCYTGLWGISAACWGAREVTACDTSAAALEMAEQNARLNDVDDRCSFMCADVQTVLNDKKRYGIIMLDPPALAKTRGQKRKALGAYLALNRLAMEAVAPGGWLFTSSCSHFVDPSEFLEILKRAARSAQRDAWVVRVCGAASDHPVLMEMPETAYLTCAALRLA